MRGALAAVDRGRIDPTTWVGRPLEGRDERPRSSGLAGRLSVDPMRGAIAAVDPTYAPGASSSSSQRSKAA